MDIYSYFLNKKRWFIPKTPNAAIAGIKKGIVPIESFISLSLFLYSPFGSPGKLDLLNERQELQRIEELERIISKEKKDLDTEVLLIYTLNKLVEHKNPEIALFAAESINSIENRYNKRIYELKELLSKNSTIEDTHEIITLLYQYGFINTGKEDIQIYYYKEALNYLSLIDDIDLSISILVIKLKILIELDEFTMAKHALNRLDNDFLPDWQKTILLLQIEFKARNFDEITKIVNSCNKDSMPKKYQELVNLWIN